MPSLVLGLVLGDYLDDILKKINYKRPKGEAVLNAKDYSHVYSHGDWVLMDGFKGFVMEGNRKEYIPTPNTACFGVSDPRVFSAGNYIMVETQGGEYEVRRLEKVVGRVVFIDRAHHLGFLNHPPAHGANYFKVLGHSSTLIDERFDGKIKD